MGKYFQFRSRYQAQGDFEPFSIIDHKAYQYYKSKSVYNNRKDVAHFVEHGKILSEYYRIIGEKIVESSGGVFIEGLGYFGVVMSTNGKKGHNHRTSEGLKTVLNVKTNGIVYNLVFVPITKDNTLIEWNFDNTFVKSVRKRLQESLNSGKKYTFNPQMFFHRALKSRQD